MRASRAMFADAFMPFKCFACSVVGVSLHIRGRRNVLSLHKVVDVPEALVLDSLNGFRDCMVARLEKESLDWVFRF